MGHHTGYATSTTITDLVSGVEAAVGPDAIDVVYDGVGTAVYDDSLRLLRLRGSTVTFGNASGAVEPKVPLTRPMAAAPGDDFRFAFGPLGSFSVPVV